MPRRQFEGGRRQAWREDRAARDEQRQQPVDRIRSAAPPPAGDSPVEPQQAPPVQPRRRFQPGGPESADALLKRLGVDNAGFAEQYYAVQEYVRTANHPLSGALRSELRRRLLLPRRGNGRPMVCERLEDVRANLDRVDQQIVELLAERSAYVAQAADFKTDEASVADPQRVEQVIAQARGWAVARDLDPDLVEVVYRTMVPAFIAYESARRTDLADSNP
jgi:isochorismate pyruvate lyase